MLVVGISAMAGCSTAPKIETAGDLVAQLQTAGVQFDSQEPAPMPKGEYFRFDEGLRLKGQDLFLDVLRIEDERVFGIAKSAGAILAVAEASAGQHIPDNPEVFARRPFVIVIRQQPEGSSIQATLANLLPPEQE